MNRLLASVLMLAPLLAGLAPTESRATSDREWRFEVFLDDRPIGYHSFRLSSTAGSQQLSSEAGFRVKVLGLTIYTYVHHSLEQWQQDCLHDIDASTDDNGDGYYVRGTRRGDHLFIENRSGETGLPGCVMTFAYWNPAILEQQQLLNVQTGDYLQIRVQALGEQPLQLGGRPVPAAQYRIFTDGRQIDLWYSGERDWLALRSTTSDGRELHYRRVLPESGAKEHLQ